MSAIVEIDETDVKILQELLRDARVRLKDIAKSCGLSSTAILNRISRLKASGVITGALLFVNMSQMGFMYPASIGVDLKPDQKIEVFKILRKQTNLAILSEGAGNNSFTIFFVAKSMKEIDDFKQLIRKQAGSRKITVSIWSTPHFNFENIDLQPTKG